MKLWLTKQGNGLYMLTYFKPTIETVHGTENKKEVYILPGEPIGIRNLCDRILLAISFPENAERLKSLQSIQVELTGKVI
jgi:hypothetical protein